MSTPPNDKLSKIDFSEMEFLKERYSEVSRIGEGGMGVVFRGLDQILLKWVAIKFIAARDVSEDEAIRFQKEAKAASKLNHPNLISVMDFGASPSGELFLIMEYVEGEPLSKTLKKEGRLQEDRVKKIAIEICKGMEHAHNQGIVHRDLKPSNIMVTTQGGIKVLDFGIAKLNDQSEVEQSLTRTGAAMGSPVYMSPEQIRGEAIDARSDIYSLGCLLYRMLYGRPPFLGDTAIDTMRMHLEETPAGLEETPAENLPPVRRGFKEILSKTLEKDREKRIQTMADLESALHAIVLAKDEQTVVYAPESGRKGQRPGAKHIAVIGISAALLMVATFYFSNAYFAGKQKKPAKKSQVQALISLPEKEFIKDKFHNELFWKPREPLQVTDDDLKQLEKQVSSGDNAAMDKQLSLFLCGTAVTGEGLKYLKGWQCKEIYLDQTKLTDDGLKQLNRLENLTKLHLVENNITDKGLAALSPSSIISHIVLARCPSITDKGIETLANSFPNLIELGIGSTGATGSCLDSLAKSTNLKDLSISDLDLTDQDIDKIRGLDLRTLDLCDNERLTDSCLENLAGMKNLSSLYLDGCPLISDQAIKKLKMSLSEDTKISHQKVRQTKKQLESLELGEVFFSDEPVP